MVNRGLPGSIAAKIEQTRSMFRKVTLGLLFYFLIFPLKSVNLTRLDQWCMDLMPNSYFFE